MKKIPTLFERVYKNHCVCETLPNVTSGMEWVLAGEGVATLQTDGSCCAIINGEFYKRYDAKKGKKPPEGAIPCCEPDPATGHWPHWIKVDPSNNADKWFMAAYNNTLETTDGTYEAVGTHFQGNPHSLIYDMLERHGIEEVDVPRTFEGLREYLSTHIIEGIVFWKDGEPQCKIKRSDFGFDWPVKEKV